MISFRAVAAASILAGSLSVAGLGSGPVAAAKPDEVQAYLDGRKIPIEDVSKYYCDDFSYPVIECSSLPLVTEARAVVVELLTGVTFVTIYDFTNYSGAYMHVSQNYSEIITIGWNDKISSYKARNSETGRFWTDWFFSGTLWSFCCNANVSSLGSYNNTFSSIERT